ncbi:MAG: hypothetical protein Q7J32_05520 [Sphingomonadaceae bacterium]|nr:hypothetical protein [Sphingomonadaceae bacterium]
MRNETLMIFSVAASLLAVPAVAQTAAPAQPQTAAVDDKDKVVCRREVETGSIAKRKKICHTKREWEALAQRTRDAMDQGQMSGSASGQ